MLDNTIVNCYCGKVVSSLPQSNNLFLNANDIAIVRELEYNTIQMSGRNQEAYYGIYVCKRGC